MPLARSQFWASAMSIAYHVCEDVPSDIATCWAEIGRVRANLLGYALFMFSVLFEWAASH
eukprot:7318977-Pyramimonas_sp.AAC.1